MSSEKIQRVGIIGAGQMGAGIAEVWAPAPGAVRGLGQARGVGAPRPAPPAGFAALSAAAVGAVA
ncbi:hypothetical protein [Nocardia brasiliensis]|uniref:hypothetical protein n=1 Tax=Nocardia brasiliensis TaxID=37326 RepID=UPI002454F70F|nr:hypothetical protein [Nocardia brasiliensis]